MCGLSVMFRSACTLQSAVKGGWRAGRGACMSFKIDTEVNASSKVTQFAHLSSQAAYTIRWLPQRACLMSVSYSHSRLLLTQSFAS